MQPQLPPDLLRILNKSDDRLGIAEKALTNDAVPVGAEFDWPAAFTANLPWNYKVADGSAIDRIAFASYFAIVGTTFGVGDGINSFNIPNYIIPNNVNQQISYVEFTSNVTVAGTSGAPTTVVTAAAFTPNGTDAYWIEFFSPQVQAGSADTVEMDLYDGGTRLGTMGITALPATQSSFPFLVKRIITPTNASHTYSVRAWRVTSTGIIIAGAGTSGTPMPGYILITSAATNTSATHVKIIKVV